MLLQIITIDTDWYKKLFCHGITTVYFEVCELQIRAKDCSADACTCRSLKVIKVFSKDFLFKKN